jgi:EmrB/QacA subfamily drug resistance transporter
MTAEQPALSPTRVGLIVAVIAIASFIQMLDSAILATAIPNMARSFGVGPVDLGIGITSYIMAALVVIPVTGWIASRLGAREVFVAGLAGFTVASLLCGLSQSLPQFIGARILQGLAGGVLSPIGAAITMGSIPPRDRIRMTNFVIAPTLVAPVLGPPVGGLITTYLSWHWIFFINVPICLVAAVLAARVLPDPTRQRRPFDGLGFLLNSLSLTTLIYGLSELGGDTLSPWLAGGIAGFGLCVGVAAVGHAARAAHPLVALIPMRYPTFSLVSVWAAPFMRLPVAALPFALPILLQVGFGMSAALSGTLFLSHALGDLLMKAVVGRVFKRFGYRSVMLACVWGLGVTMAGCALFTRATPLAAMAALLLASGCFRSFLNTGIGTLSYADLPNDVLPNGAALNQVVMQVAQAVGVSVTVLMMQGSTLLRRHPLGQTDGWDCRVALLGAALISLLAVLPLRKLARNAGAEISGHRSAAQ